MGKARERVRRRRDKNLSVGDVAWFDDSLFINGYTQYRLNGPGISPTTRTYKRIQAGAYTIGYIQEQLTFIPFEIKTDDIIRLPDTKSDEIISEIQKFWTLKERFKQHGFVHKRGFLLHGPPGSGKTATIQFVIADMIANDGIVIMAGVPSLLSEALMALRAIEPDRKVLVIFEDIDEIIKEYNEAEVLAVLDGEKQIDGVVFIATTNYPENLDGRIKNRPSRFDRVEKIDVPSDEARKVYLTHKLSDYLSEAEIDKWVAMTKGFSIAHIKELIVNVMCLDNDIESQVERLKSMKKNIKSDDTHGPVGFGGYRV